MQSVAQSTFVPATLNLPGKQTRSGLIDFRQWARNPSHIYFKENMEASPTLYKPLDILGFEIIGSEKYESGVVKKDMVTLNPELGLDTSAIAVITDTVFLRVLFEGNKFTLYNLRDSKNRFYVKDMAGIFTELGFGKYLYQQADGREFVIPNNLYKNQLMSFVTDIDRLAELRAAAEKMKYHEKSIVGFARLIHGEDPNSHTEIVHLHRQKLNSIFVGAGFTASTFQLKGHMLLDNLKFSNAITPAITVGYDWFGKRQQGAFFVRAAIQYFTMKLDGQKTTTSLTNEIRTYNYTNNINSISPSLALFYSFYNNGKLRAYAGPSAATNFSTYSNQMFTEKINRSGIESVRTDSEYFSFEKAWLNLHANAGIIYNNKWQIDIAHDFAGTFSRYINFTIQANILQVKAAVRF